jgi:hypothetical protein
LGRVIPWPMTATLHMDEDGRIRLPEALRVALGLKPGVPKLVEVAPVNEDTETNEISEGIVENGVLLLPRTGIEFDVAAAIRADRDARALRGARR